MTRSRASNQEFQKPWWAVQPGQISVVVVSKSKFVSHESMLVLPRKETMMRLLVWSTATKPVTSVDVSCLVDFSIHIHYASYLRHT
jgi:hypothetical protein